MPNTLILSRQYIFSPSKVKFVTFVFQKLRQKINFMIYLPGIDICDLPIFTFIRIFAFLVVNALFMRHANIFV